MPPNSPLVYHIGSVKKPKKQHVKRKKKRRSAERHPIRYCRIEVPAPELFSSWAYVVLAVSRIEPADSDATQSRAPCGSREAQMVTRFLTAESRTGVLGNRAIQIAAALGSDWAQFCTTYTATRSCSDPDRSAEPAMVAAVALSFSANPTAAAPYNRCCKLEFGICLIHPIAVVGSVAAHCLTA